MTSRATPPEDATESRLRVRYAETDAMGIAHHAEYLAWFEVGRTDWMRLRGAQAAGRAGSEAAGRAGAGAGARSYRRLEELGWHLPVVEIGARYVASATYDDEIAVVTRLEGATRARFTFAYEVVRLPGRDPLASGRSVHAVTDRAGRATRMPQPVLDWVLGGPEPHG